MIKRQKIVKGAILEINIENRYYTYAQILGGAVYAFFDYKTEQKLIDFSILENKPILFIVGVYDDVIITGHWLIVHKMDVRDDLKVLPMQFIQDALNPERFEIYNPNTGDITPAKKNECRGLERAAVWEANHVEDRIRDYYDAVPCIWLEEDRELFKD